MSTINQENLDGGNLRPGEALVERIRRAVGGGTDAEIAEKLGVKPQAISNWKRGEGPKRTRLKEIADTYNVSIDFLQYGDDAEEGVSDQVGERKYESLFNDVSKLNPEHKAKFDAIMEYAEHQVAQMLREQGNESSSRKGKKS